MTEAERAAFEARLRAEPDVQRRLDVTRLLVATARALPAQPLPRDFTLPLAASAAPQTRPGARVNPLNWFLRLGSALAAAVFVIAIGLDLAGLSAPPAQPPAPATQAAFAAPTPQSKEAMAADAAMAVPAEAGEAAPAGAAPEAQPASGEQPMQAMRQAAEPAVETQPTPEQPAQPMAAPIAAAETAPAATPEAESMQPAVVTEAPATRVDALPASQPTEAPQSPDATMRPSESAPQSDTTPWLRIVAGVALALAVSLGVLGWRRS